MKQILLTFLFGVFLLPLAHAQSAPEKKKTFCNLYDNRPAISDGALAGCPKSVVDLARLANGWLSEATSKGEKARGCRHFQQRFEEIALERVQALQICNDQSKVKLGTEGEMLARNEQAAQMRASAISHLEDCVAKLESARVKAFNQTQQSIRVVDKSTLRDRQTARDLNLQVKRDANTYEKNLGPASFSPSCTKAKTESLQLVRKVEQNYNIMAEVAFQSTADVLAAEKLRFQGALLKIKAMPTLTKNP
jgi:hypothetical protein